ncbi:MAG: OmpH family outer membrane protein [Paracoccaceae bacterium]
MHGGSVTLARLLLAGLLLAAPSPMLAQQQAPPQLLTLDQERLYSGSQYGKALEAKSLADTQALVAQNRKIEADLATEEADLTEQRKTVTPEAFQTLADAFDVKVEKIRAEQEAKATALKVERDAHHKEFFDAAVPVLGEVMRQSGAYVMLNHDAVILSFDSIDVTDRAIAEMDKKLGDGTKPPVVPAP